MNVSDALFWHRLQFAFTIVYHYLFPQLTMGLAFLIVVMKALALRSRDARWNDAAAFWIRIFALNFAMGVVTGIPMEFQFGTNWARFSAFAGPVIGHTLAMEGLFAFFLESSFLSLLVWGEKRLGPTGHFAAAVALWIGSWLSGYFIIATNAFMQHPVGHEVGPSGALRLVDFSTFLFNPWALIAYVHTMIAAVVTGSFVVAAVGALYALQGRHADASRRFLKAGVTVGLIASVLVAFPTGDRHAKMVARYQPVALAAMEGRFVSGPMADITLIGQPNVAARRLDNPIRVPGVLSFLAYGTFHSNVAGLDAFPEDSWPDNIELLYYAFHVMAGLGTMFIGLMALSTWLLWRGRLHVTRPLLWCLMLAFPFPYIATTAGWITAELGRQPWLVYGLLRTKDGASANVSSGTALFTLIGFTGLYFVLGLLFVFLVGREIAGGPERGRSMVELWFAIVASMFTAYVVLDGFDFGAGALHLVVAKTNEERRRVLGAIGPYWDGNEVWLLAAGGALFVAFPRVLASGLSGFYFAIFLVLWALIGRGIAIEFRSHVTAPLWRSFWDVIFSVASASLAVLFGAALGNLVRGLPLDANGWFSLSLFTDFTPRDPVGILDWYTVSTGVFALVALSAHGAAFLAWKTDGAVQQRARHVASLGFIVVGALWPIVTVATRIAAPDFLAGFPTRPFAWLGAVTAVAGLASATYFIRRGADRSAFLGSATFLSGLMVATAACAFPALLRSSSDPALAVTAYAASNDGKGLATALKWWLVGFPLAIGYFVVVFRLHRGKVAAAAEGEGY